MALLHPDLPRLHSGLLGVADSGLLGVADFSPLALFSSCSACVVALTGCQASWVLTCVLDAFMFL